MLTGYIRGQELRISTPEIAADSIKYLEAVFHFAGRDWDGYVKTAYFINGASKFALVLADDRITADMGLNLTAGEWEVKLSGVKGDSRITTTTEHIYVREFGGTEGTLPDVTPTQAEQLLAKIGDMAALETEAKGNLVAAINEAAQTGGGGTGDHSKLKNRDAADQHPMSAITGLASALEGKQPVGEYLSPDNLQSATDAALAQAKASGEFDGAKGDKGADGAAGADGVTPHIGDNGNWYLGTTDTGKPSRGETGLQGPVGPVGPQGPQGEKGDAGDDIVDTVNITAPAYTNKIPASVDADGGVYNGVGYKSGVYLDSAGAEISGQNVVVSGYIPVKKGDIIRIKDVSQANIDTSQILTLTAAKAGTAGCGKTIASIQGNGVYGTITINGNVATWDTSSIDYYFWDGFAWLRVTTHSVDAVVTVNEEIKETITTKKILKENVKVKKANVDFDIASPLLSGKTVVCFGDSIFGMTRDSTSVPAWAAAFTGAQVYNVGFGGCRMAVHPTSGYAAFSMWALAEAVASGNYTTQDAQASSGADYFPQQLAVLKSIDFAAVDMAVIHYGTNDFTGNVVIDDATNGDNTATLCGALRYAIGKLQTAYPKLRIFVSLPIYRKWDSVGSESYTNGNGNTLREFGIAMASVADEFNCPCIDGYKTLGINAANAAAFLADGTHLNDYGRQVFGEYIGGCLAAPSSPHSEKGEDAAADLTLGLTGATVGQIAKITAVDASGVPTAWSPVDMPSGGGGDGGAEEFRLIQSITLDEQSDRVDISVDSSGNAFALHEVYVMLAAQSYDDATADVFFLPNGLWTSTSPYITSVVKASKSSETWKNNMGFHSVYADGVMCSEQLPAKGQNQNLTASFAAGQSIITKISMGSKFAAGCTFFVIGR